MYRVMFPDPDKGMIMKYFDSQKLAETYARRIHDILNVYVHIHKVEETFILNLLPRNTNA